MSDPERLLLCCWCFAPGPPHPGEDCSERSADQEARIAHLARVHTVLTEMADHIGKAST